jgi:hypothetical protein
MAVVGSAIAGCAVVDQYSGRALGYNVEAAQASQQTILLNIVRASQRHPMQFTMVSTITGTASSSGTFGLSAPLGAGGAQYKTGTLGGSFSGGPSFTVPVLDTKEFYYGLMNPIPPVLIDLYIQAGYPRDLLYNLFIDRIVVHNDTCDDTQHNADCEFTFLNHVYSPVALDLFQGFIGYLIELGFTTQKIEQPKSADSGNPPEAATPPAKSKAAQATDTPPPPDYAFCFSTTIPEFELSLVPPESRCDSAAKRYASHAAAKAKLAEQKVKTVTAQLNKTTQILKDSSNLKAAFSVTAVQKNKMSTGKVDDLPAIVKGLPKEQLNELAQAIQKAEPNSVLQAVETTLTQQEQSLKKNLTQAKNDKTRKVKEQNAEKTSGAKKEAKKIGSKSVQDVILSRGIIDYLIAIAKTVSEPNSVCDERGPSFVKGGASGDPKYNVCGALAQFLRDGRGGRKDKVNVTVSVYIRSTENLIYYLGELARYEREAGTVAKFRPQYVYSDPQPRVCDERVKDRATECTNIFVLNSGGALVGNSQISVLYENTIYSVPTEGAGYSMQVLEIVKQLLAMSSSATSLPQTNVISVINP